MGRLKSALAFDHSKNLPKALRTEESKITACDAFEKGFNTAKDLIMFALQKESSLKPHLYLVEAVGEEEV